MIDLIGFRAMGCQVWVYGPAGETLDRAVERVERRFATEEARFSRFRSESELARVNEMAGSGWIGVSEPFEGLVRTALRYAAETDGAFDPAVLHALVAAGYDRDFDEVLAGARAALRPAERCGRWREIDVRPGAVRLPAGVGLDLGGIAKGWTVDRAAEDALAEGLPWALVSAGGDMRVIGQAPELDIPVEDPREPANELGRLRLSSGALATSTTVRRSWGEGRHHVIDPLTGAPADTPLLQATVWATTCVRAEVLATEALLRGPDTARTRPGVFLTSEGDVLVSAAIDEAAA